MKQTTTVLYRNQLAFRGIAALWVFIGHLLYGRVYNAGFADARGWGALGDIALLHFLAVDGFFLLSGCLLALNYWEQFSKQSTGKQIDCFYLRRLARIYPLHLLGIAIIAVYAYLGVKHPISSGFESVIFQHWQWTLILNLAGMNAWGIVPVSSWNEPAWTVSAMMFVYILFPNLVITLKLVRTAYYPLIIIVLLLAYFALRQSIDLASNSDGAGALIRALIFFIIGMLMGRLYAAKWRVLWAWDSLLGACITAFALCIVLWWRIGPFDMLPFHVLTIALIFCLLRADGVVSRLIVNSLTCWLGNLSYALFLMHYPVLLAIKAAYGNELARLSQSSESGAVFAYILTITIVIVTAFLAHHFIEVPTNLWLKRKLKD